MGFQSSNINNTSIELKESDLEKITKKIISSLAPLIGSGKTVYIQGKDNVQEEVYTPESMEKLAKAMISKQVDQYTNFKTLGTTKEIKKDNNEINKTLDLLKNLE